MQDYFPPTSRELHPRHPAPPVADMTSPTPSQAIPPTPGAGTASQLVLDTEGIATEVRRDYLHDYYVLIAPKRRDRPYDTASHDHPLVETSDSPRLDLQPSTYELPGPNGQWLVKVVANKYPALSADNAQAYGFQELVIDTPLANVAFGELPAEQIGNVLLAYQQRSRTLKQHPHIKYVSIFRNDGYEAGASLAHAHSQIIALPFIPPRLLQESITIEQLAQHKSVDPYDTILQFETKDGSRIIAETDDWLCFAPYAPRWQMEAWILPKRPVTALEDLTVDEITSLAPQLKLLTSKLTAACISYNLAIEQGVTEHQRLCLKLRGRNVVSPQGGFEVATDIIINVIPPESAAKWYQKT